jgi:hypothetical protein
LVDTSAAPPPATPPPSTAAAAPPSTASTTPPPALPSQRKLPLDPHVIRIINSKKSQEAIAMLGDTNGRAKLDRILKFVEAFYAVMKLDKTVEARQQRVELLIRYICETARERPRSKARVSGEISGEKKRKRTNEDEVLHQLQVVWGGSFAAMLSLALQDKYKSISAGKCTYLATTLVGCSAPTNNVKEVLPTVNEVVIKITNKLPLSAFKLTPITWATTFLDVLMQPELNAVQLQQEQQAVLGAASYLALTVDLMEKHARGSYEDILVSIEDPQLEESNTRRRRNEPQQVACMLPMALDPVWLALINQNQAFMCLPPLGLSPLDFSQFAGAPLAGVPFAGAPFASAPLVGEPFASAPFAGAPFASAPFAGAPFAGAPFAGAPFASAPLVGAPFASAPFAGAPFASGPFAGAQ